MNLRVETHIAGSYVTVFKNNEHFIDARKDARYPNLSIIEIVRNGRVYLRDAVSNHRGTPWRSLRSHPPRNSQGSGTDWRNEMSQIEVMKQAANAIEKLAFEIPAPNSYTPRFVMLANELMRQAIEQAEKEKPVACRYCRASATLGAVYYDQNCEGCVKRMAPTAPTAPAQQPIPEDVIMDATRDVCREFRWPSTALEVWRLAEKAHSIKGASL